MNTKITIDGIEYNNATDAINDLRLDVAFINDPADDAPYTREKFIDAVLAGNVVGEYTTYSAAGWVEFCESEASNTL